MSNAITLIEEKDEARIDSRVLAAHLDIQHKNVLALIDENDQELQEINPLAFKTQVANRKQGGGTPTRYVLLTEDQAYFLLTLSRNTDRTRQLKLNLIQSFGRFRREWQNAIDYLPFYHDLHDTIKVLAAYAHANGSSTKEHIFHLTYNKLINKACGIESGQRQNLYVNARVNITNVTAAVITTIKRGIDSGMSHHDIYQRAKVEVEAVIYTGKRLLKWQKH